MDYNCFIYSLCESPQLQSGDLSSSKYGILQITKAYAFMSF